MLLIIRLVLFLLIARAVLMLARGVVQGLNDGRRAVPPATGVQLVRDPVCGVYVTPSNALTLRSGTGTAYFCSEKCRQAWRKP
jgi:YHS domain-containing protein